MYIFENRIEIESRDLIEEYLRGFEYQTSGLSFSSLYMWRDSNKFSWQVIGDYLCISGISHLELEQGIELPFMFVPLTKTGKYEAESLRQTLLEAKDIFEKAGQRFNMRLVPEHMLSIIEEARMAQWEFVADRPNYDYIYDVKSLIELKGRRYHGKKGHLNYFRKNFEYEYVRLEPSMWEEAMEFIEEFNARKDVPEHEMAMLEHEKEAMKDVFKNIDVIGYIAGAIRIDGKIEAISIGGQLGKCTVTVHVEKANVNYRGLYQAINNEFCRALPQWIKYVNREEDMGLENLRKAKLSYKPVKLLEKFICTVNF